jgi:hypothetical protein
MKYLHILLWGVILGLCLSLAATASEPALKKVSPPPGFERVGGKSSKSTLEPIPPQDETFSMESQIDPLEVLDLENVPDPRPFTPPRHYLCLQAQRAIIIDGRFNEIDWQKALWSEIFTDIRAPYGSSQPAPTTKFKMLWDEKFLYVAVILSDYNIRAKGIHRDNPESVDFDLEMYIDANADNQQYHVLKINALNALQSLVYDRPPKDGGTGNPCPVEGLQHAVLIEGTLNNASDRDKAWQVEMAIPLAMPALRGGVSKYPANGDTWRINFARVEWRGPLVLSADRGNYKPQQLAAMEKLIRCCWTPQGVVNMHRPETWGYLQFYRQPAGFPANFEPDPTEWSRYALHKVLYAQKWYHANVGTYTDSLDVLGLDKTPPMFATEPIRIKAGQNTFRASVQLRMPNMSLRTISIDQQAKLAIIPN